MSIQFDKVQPKTKEQLKQLINYAFKHDIYDLNFIDTSKITNMCELFEYVEHDFNVSSCDVSNVTYMNGIFNSCFRFKGKGLENWNVSNVTSMYSMFTACENFEGKGLENWDISNVVSLRNMFKGCENFDCDFSKWNVSNVVDTTNMFYGCTSLKNKPRWYKE